MDIQQEINAARAKEGAAIAGAKAGAFLTEPLRFSPIGARCVITKREGVDGWRVVATSRNLRGILSHASRHGVTGATVYGSDESRSEGYPVFFAFGDGSESRVMFADWRVAVRFIRARRSWGIEPLGQGPTQFSWRAPSW